MPLCLLAEKSIVNRSCRNCGNKNCGRPLCCCLVVENRVINGSCRNRCNRTALGVVDAAVLAGWRMIKKQLVVSVVNA